MKHISSLLLAVSLLFSVFSAKAVEGGVYLSGPFNYYGMTGFSDKWELTSEDGDVYTGTFDIPSEKLIFNITNYIEDGNYTIFGSRAREGSRVSFEFEEGDGCFEASMAYAGEGDWAWEDWPGGAVTFRIDLSLETPVVTVTTFVNPMTGEIIGDDTGIDMIINNEAELKIYNLQGIRVSPEDLKSGLYIVNGKKIIIRN